MLNEFKRVTAQTFYNAFCMRLRNKLGDIEYAFDAKWSQIEAAFYEALGEDQVITRCSKFISEGATSFGGTPMEQPISDIWSHVCRIFGRNPNNAQWRLGETYRRIFEIAETLPADFKIIKNHGLQTSGDELVKINDAKSIEQYMEDLKK